jgi:hypothetical protein
MCPWLLYVLGTLTTLHIRQACSYSFSSIDHTLHSPAVVLQLPKLQCSACLLSMQVYECSGSVQAVRRSKAPINIPHGASFDDYLNLQVVHCLFAVFLTHMVITW